MTDEDPRRAGGDVIFGDLRLNWWVWYAGEAWINDEKEEFWDALDNAFINLKSTGNFT